MNSTDTPMVLRACEAALITRIRELAMPYGSLKLRVTVEYQDTLPVLFRLGRVIVQEERVK